MLMTVATLRKGFHMLSQEHIAMQWAKMRQEELREERRNDQLLRFLIREYKSQLRERASQLRGQKQSVSDK
jgi:adenosine deaminase